MDNETEGSPAGNAAAMREALEEARRDLWDIMGSSSESARSNMACVMSRKIRDALAAPPRNCDVGTPEEQLERWESFCGRNWNTNYASRGLDPCDDCELVEFGNCRCQFLWAQMPCVKEESNG